MKHVMALTALFLIFFSGFPTFAENEFTQRDRELLTELQKNLIELRKDREKDRELLMELQKNLIELRKEREKDMKLLIEMNVKIGEIDKRFEQIDKRFEQVDKRLEFMQNLMIGMLAVFGGLCGVFIGLLLWDRRTFKEKAKEEAIKAVEEGKLKNILTCLREYANVEPRLKDILKKFHLL